MQNVDISEGDAVTKVIREQRILFLDHVGVLGGAELCLLDTARHFESECEVILFEDGPFSDRLSTAGIIHDVISSPKAVQRISRDGNVLADLLSLAGVFSLGLKIARKTRKFKILYANSQKSFVVGVIASLLARRPLVWHLHDLLTSAHFSKGHLRLTVSLANWFADRVIANSKGTAISFVKQGGDPKKVFVVYNGIDPTPFEAVSERETAFLRKSLGMEGKQVVGVFSRLSPWKGQDILLDALTKIDDVHALIVGKALFGDEEQFEQSLMTKVQTRGLQDRVLFLGFREDISALMKAVDVVVHTSKIPEPFGRVVAEGLLAGRPVIATRGGGVPEIICDGETGMLVEPGDPEALARALHEVFSSYNKYFEMAQVGRSHALEHFSCERVFSRLSAHFDAISPPKENMVADNQRPRP